MHNRRISSAVARALGAGAALLFARGLVRAARTRGLRGKTVLIMGGSRGLGLDLARTFVAKGCRVALCARDPDEVERARRALAEAEAEVLAGVCDATDRAQVDRFVDVVTARFGGIDVLVTNAATIQVGPLEAMTTHDFEEAMTSIFWSAFWPTMAVLPQMRQRRAGRIAHVTSFGGKVPAPHLLPYSTAKFATTGFSGGLRAEVAKDGLRVTTISPGLLRTGAHVNAPVKGRRLDEYRWFALGITLPFVSMGSRRAARKIVRAVANGDAEATLSFGTRLATIAYALAPGLVSRMLAIQNRLLPSPEGGSTTARSGQEVAAAHPESAAVKAIDALGRANAEAHHAYPGPIHAAPTRS